MVWCQRAQRAKQKMVGVYKMLKARCRTPRKTLKACVNTQSHKMLKVTSSSETVPRPYVRSSLSSVSLIYEFLHGKLIVNRIENSTVIDLQL